VARVIEALELSNNCAGDRGLTHSEYITTKRFFQPSEADDLPHPLLARVGVAPVGDKPVRDVPDVGPAAVKQVLPLRYLLPASVTPVVP